MLLGFYLSLSSIISLSYISDNEDLKIPIALRFDSTFKKIDTNYVNRENIKTMGDKLKLVNNIYNDIIEIHGHMQSEELIKDSIKVLYNKQASPIIQLLTKQITLLTNAQRKIVRAHYAYNQNRVNLFQQAQSSFKENINILSSGLLSKYSYDLISFLVQIPSDEILSFSDNNWDKNCSILKLTLDNTYGNLRKLAIGMVNSKFYEDLLNKDVLGINLLPQDSDYNIQIPVTKLELPKPGKFGEDWGVVFAPFIEWIAGSKNNDVLLLVGMIGFALFGATISTFVINPLVTQNSLSENILSAIIKGFSAAIVVFLAARGGIAILNNGKSDPNPLILFLFCFIGAVFSERIWNWARQQVSTRFPSDEINRSQG